MILHIGFHFGTYNVSARGSYGNDIEFDDDYDDDGFLCGCKHKKKDRENRQEMHFFS